LSGHRARLLTRELVESADLVLTMARHHRARVDELGGEGRVFVLGEYAGREGDEAEVSDPFGGDLDVYRDTCTELEGFIQAALEGDNTDVAGILTALRQLGADGGGSWLLLGTGGAARAVAVAAATARADLHVVSRDAARARAFSDWAQTSGARAAPAQGALQP